MFGVPYQLPSTKHIAVSGAASLTSSSLEEILQFRNGYFQTIFIGYQLASGLAQRAESSRIGKHTQRGLHVAIRIEQWLSQTVDPRFNHLAHRRYVRPQDHTTTRQRI